jgi:hypothetical protein
MRNGPGDLATVLGLYAVEFAIAALVLQPWRLHPHRGPIALGALAFAGWAILRWLIGLHSPTVMFGHDVLMLVVALALSVSVVAFRPPPPPATPLEPVAPVG